MPQVCEALQFAHDSGIVHREIKPGNILLDKKGLVKIADFGVAKMIAESLSKAAEKSTAAAGPGEYAHIKQFLVQRRDFQWVEFDNISFQQGHLTSVTAKVY